MTSSRLGLLGECPDPETDLVMWVIHNRLTLDYPGYYVLRRQWTHRAASGEGAELVIDLVAHVDHDIEPLRERIPPGLVRMPRQPADAFTIVEMWF